MQVLRIFQRFNLALGLGAMDVRLSLTVGLTSSKKLGDGPAGNWGDREKKREGGREEYTRGS